MSRSVSTRVLPLPAAADTSTVLPRVSIAARCSRVKFSSGIRRASFQVAPDLVGRELGQHTVAVAPAPGVKWQTVR